MNLSRRSPFAIHLAVFSLIITLGVVACGKKPTALKEEASVPSAEQKAEEKKPDAAPAAPAAGTGSIKGKVSFTGTAPDMPELKREADPFCAKTKMKDPAVTVNSNNTLKNVAVMVTKGAAPAAAPESVAKITVDQQNCMYEPRVKSAVAGQTVQVTNSDPILHNVHTYSGDKTLFNRAQPKNSPAIDKQFTKEDGPVVKFKCDVHPWMTGWLIVSDNTLNAITGETGEFEIKDVPAGTYTLQAWHEVFGPKTIEVKVEADKPAEANFTYDGSEKVAYQYKEFDISPIMVH